VVVNVPAVAVKFADVVPDATLTEAGTANAAALLESATVAPPEPADLDNVTVQADDPPVVRLVGLHDSALTVVCASSDMYAD